MSKLILSMMTSLDGHIARSDGNMDWFLTDAQLEEEMLTVLQSVRSMIFGRLSYELLAQYWPTAGTAAAQEAPGGFTSKQREVQFAQLMNAIPKVVCSRTLRDPPWGPVTVVRELNPEVVARQKREVDKDIVLFAGAQLARSFAELDLFDEYRLMVHPIVLGRGIRLFDALAQERTLRLQRQMTFPSGIVLLQYQRAR